MAELNEYQQKIQDLLTELANYGTSDSQGKSNSSSNTTSKLLWKEGYYQVKLFSGINLLTAEPGGILIHFGQGHDSKYGEETIAATPKNGFNIMDRGFYKLERIKDLSQDKERYFVLRIKNDMSSQMQENGEFLVGTGAKNVECRIVSYCDLEERTEFRLATNLPEAGEFAVSNEEIGEFYRSRWQIELLWKFLKRCALVGFHDVKSATRQMHLKLDRLITQTSLMRLEQNRYVTMSCDTTLIHREIISWH
jgi:putative transposase